MSNLCDPMDYSTPGFPFLQYLPEFVQTHVHWVSNAAQPSHPLLPTSPPAISAEAEDPVCWQSDAKIHGKGEKWQFEKYLLNVDLAHVEVKIYAIYVVQEALYFVKHIKKIHYRLIGKHKCNKEIELQECKIVRLRV